MRARAAGLLLGYLADAAFGDPRRWHPVAGFGAVAARVERSGYADRRVAGVGYTAVLVGGAVGLGVLAERVAAGRPLVATALTAAATWTVLGGTSLTGHGAALAEELLAGDVDAARARIPSLCGRDPDLLDVAGMARAGTESMAENTSDAVVAPLFWGAVAGVPGLLGYRAVNTLDAMVGYRSPRYERFGWAAARLDDLANLVPARLAALLFALAAPVVGEPAAARSALPDAAEVRRAPGAGRPRGAGAGVVRDGADAGVPGAGPAGCARGAGAAVDGDGADGGVPGVGPVGCARGGGAAVDGDGADGGVPGVGPVGCARGGGAAVDGDGADAGVPGAGPARGAGAPVMGDGADGGVPGVGPVGFAGAPAVGDGGRGGGSGVVRALRAWRRDAARHPSPNAGPVEAAAAGALGVTLGGRTAYRHGVEDRPRLGEGPPPTPDDLQRAARLARVVGAAAAVVAAGVALRRP